MLIVIHPGSACGSADFNLGYVEAARTREALAQTIHNWDGPMVIIDGELSGELEKDAVIGLAIENAICSNRATRIPWKDTSAWAEHAAQTIKELTNGPVSLTGAWYEDEGHMGCVNAVEDALGNIGVETIILPCVLKLNLEYA